MKEEGLDNMSNLKVIYQKKNADLIVIVYIDSVVFNIHAYLKTLLSRN